MISHPSKQFNYVKLPGEKRRLFCLEQSLSRFAWTMFFRRDSLTPIMRYDGKSVPGRVWLQKVLNYTALVKKNILLLGGFAAYKFQICGISESVALPCYGQVCIPIHKGYKVFDFPRGAVIKIFDSEVEASVVNDEVKRLKHISHLEFAPALRKWNLEEKWYEEEYVSGRLDSSYRPMDSSTVLQRFSRDLIRPLMRIMGNQAPIARSSVEYVLELIRNLPKPGEMSTRHHSIHEFLQYILQDLQDEGNCPIFLVFAHGDFVPANMLNTRVGLRVIDWEGAGFWSAMFDFYSYFFYRPANRDVSVGIMIREVREAWPILITELEKANREFSRQVVERARVYRRIFYVEMIRRLMDRELTDTNLNIPHYAQKYLVAFQEYETLSANDALPNA